MIRSQTRCRGNHPLNNVSRGSKSHLYLQISTHGEHLSQWRKAYTTYSCTTALFLGCRLQRESAWCGTVLSQANSSRMPFHPNYVGTLLTLTSFLCMGPGLGLFNKDFLLLARSPSSKLEADITSRGSQMFYYWSHSAFICMHWKITRTPFLWDIRKHCRWCFS